MKKVLFALFCFYLPFLFSCHKKAAAKDEPATNQATVTEVKKAVMDTGADMASTGSPYKVDSLSISGNILSVFVNYAGGCKEHSFDLVSDGMYAKSLPPQLSLCLKHTGNDDMCKKLVKQELKFDVSGLQYKGGNTVILKLGEKSVRYNS